jgi:hypothetical protein
MNRKQAQLLSSNGRTMLHFRQSEAFDVQPLSRCSKKEIGNAHTPSNCSESRRRDT